jgi:RNA polymerase sigma-70 factor (ECF subfamily)
VRDSLWVTTTGDEPSDEELLAAVAEGSRTALRVLYDRHAPWLRLRLMRRCADPTIVHDTVQDTFVAVWRSAGRYDGSGTVAAWMWGIGVRRLIGQFRKQSQRSNFPLFENELRSATGNDELVVSAEELVLGGVEHGDLAGAINQLSPELRAVVQATVLDGLTTREASRLLGIPTGTVKTRMMRAKREMRTALT